MEEILNKNAIKKLEEWKDILAKEIAFVKTNLNVLEEYRNHILIKKFRNFFILFVINTLLITLLEIRKIFDKRERDDVYSLYFPLIYFSKEFQHKNLLEDVQKLKEIESEIDKYKNNEINEILKTVNKVVAHIDINKKLSAVDILSVIKFNDIIDELKEIIDYIQKMFNEILKYFQIKTMKIKPSNHTLSLHIVMKKNITPMSISEIVGVKEDFIYLLKYLNYKNEKTNP